MAALRLATTKLEPLGQVTARSPVYETAAVDAPGPSYLNAAVRLLSPLEPEELMGRLLEIEGAMGRVRTTRNAPRTIDLDLLWVLGIKLVTDRVVVPHPRLLERAFALGPLLDVAPRAVDPVTNRAYADVPYDRTMLSVVGRL